MKNNLQRIRWKKGWSQKQLSVLSHVTQQSISLIENDQSSNPSIKTALRLARALKVPVEKIFRL